MAKPSKKSATIIIIIGAVLAVIVFKAVLGFLRLREHNTDEARSKGPADAKIKIVEYIDFQCPACAQGAIYLKDLMGQNQGAIRLELNYFPLSMHRHAFTSAKYAECAARQNKFWPVHDLIIERQSNWSRLSDAATAFDQIAQEANLDRNTLDDCLKDEQVDKALLASKDRGDKLGIKSTPTYFINGQLLVGVKSLKDQLGILLQDVP